VLCDIPRIRPGVLSVSVVQHAGCPTAHTPVITHIKNKRPEINNITTNQHRNFMEVFKHF
jgi:hypothetical protein